MAKEKEKEPESPPTEEITPKPKRSLKKIIILALAATFLCAGIFIAYIIFFDEPAPSGKDSEKAQAEKVVMSMEAFLVNLADKETRRYLKVKVELEVENEKAMKELEKSVPRMRDALILLLSSKTYAEISTPEGKIKLKEEIMKRLAALPHGKKVSSAYFTEFVAQ